MKKNKKIAFVTLGKMDGASSLVKELRKRGYVCDIISSQDYVQESGFSDFLSLLLSYDLIYFRILANKSYGVELVKELTKSGKIVVNQKYLLEPKITNKAFQMDLAGSVGVSFPKFKVSPFSHVTIEGICEDFTLPVILKTSVGICGRTVFKIESEDDLKNLELSQERSCVVQEYIPYKRDIRVFCLNGDVLGVMERRPAPGDFKANISQGGSGHPVSEVTTIEKLKDMVSKLNHVFGIEIAGYDFLEDSSGNLFFLEINHNPGWNGLNKSLHVKIEQFLADYFESLL